MASYLKGGNVYRTEDYGLVYVTDVDGNSVTFLRVMEDGGLADRELGERVDNTFEWEFVPCTIEIRVRVGS